MWEKFKAVKVELILLQKCSKWHGKVVHRQVQEVRVGKKPIYSYGSQHDSSERLNE